MSGQRAEVIARSPQDAPTNLATDESPSETQAAPEGQVEAEIELSPSPSFEPEQVLAHALQALELRPARRAEGVVGDAAGINIPVPLLARPVGGASRPHGVLDLAPTVPREVQADRDL